MTSPLHARLARDLIDGIGAGRFPVGSHLPTELELSAQYGASRNTVRAALQELQDLGMISRKRRAGTRVEAAAPAVGFRHAIVSVENLIAFGAEHSRTVIGADTIVAGRALAREIGCSAGSRWLRITSLRHAPDRDAPIGLTQSYLDPRHAELEDEIASSPSALISTLVETRHGRRIAEIRQEIDASIVPAEIATSLHCDAGAPALRILRRYLDPAGVAFLITTTLHPAGQFTLFMRLLRETDPERR
ncbi:GntR family transcriptional regulator [Enterovirga rhinocerotis]|uniref:DNA-binding GntR family transcriptional regulator n=1 Tax=Enterovirga rhinocerotis TaxID=1339210 RepID=A0A4R7BLA3_9HYPH|nr:GntR family transcriptional regulator [Enterovirga rhinocerotis]TDR85402.1 DNA-binding GntR family transcriptional regulator [Enterovirga rhinocerotis]